VFLALPIIVLMSPPDYP